LLRTRVSLRLELHQNSLDPILMLDAFIELESDFGHAAEAHAAAELAAQKRRGALERAAGLALGFVVAEERVEHARELEIRRHFDASERDQTNPGIVDFREQELADLLPDAFCDAVRSRSLRHQRRYST
jgi:hypothetical protein